MQIHMDELKEARHSPKVSTDESLSQPIPFFLVRSFCGATLLAAAQTPTACPERCPDS